MNIGLVGQKHVEAVNAEIKAAIINGAKPVAVHGFCVNGKVYQKDANGNFEYLTAGKHPVECK